MDFQCQINPANPTCPSRIEWFVRNAEGGKKKTILTQPTKTGSFFFPLRSTVAAIFPVIRLYCRIRPLRSKEWLAAGTAEQVWGMRRMEAKVSYSFLPNLDLDRVGCDRLSGFLRNHSAACCIAERKHAANHWHAFFLDSFRNSEESCSCISPGNKQQSCGSEVSCQTHC